MCIRVRGETVKNGKMKYFQDCMRYLEGVKCSAGRRNRRAQMANKTEKKKPKANGMCRRLKCEMCSVPGTKPLQLELLFLS